MALATAASSAGFSRLVMPRYGKRPWLTSDLTEIMGTGLSWGRYATARAKALGVYAAASRLSANTRPLFGLSCPAHSLSMVDLPEPFAPMIAVRQPFSRVQDTPRRTGSSW